MNFHVVIPARLASTRLPGKVLREIAGVPMIEHVCRAAAASSAASVIVATDSAQIAAVAEGAGARALMTRADHGCGSDRIAEVVAGRAWADDAIVVNVQADEPMMPPALIDQVAGALVDDPGAAIATAATPIETAEDFINPNIVKVIAAAGRALYFSRAPIPFQRDGDNTDLAGMARRHLGIYAYRVAALRAFAAAPPGRLERCESLEQLRAFEIGLPIALVDAVALPGPGVDTEADLALVERKMQRT
ncbi:3-deoxy-manno-octulosonate cytidylyltransferase [Salinisphaera sp.]|uniref:3-deoxy-manno-octulosonate cytidylyltransferase n=1 Tax=Salinisphaera sp. TaxID=1914330 RepID=UPI002D77FEE7|nr:3-deoxy-manno-octulosonate cytidylyltransferase [Salinisphaera sp.]HET7314713.1 3-deoxy-manno-octulosonate cytidylyltransferase [Salinisphaera sp.]